MIIKEIENLKISKLFVFLSLFLVILYFVSRLVHLTLIPVFVDEAIYVRWSQVMRAVASLRFLPLSDGKQPFFMWLMIPFLKVFANPLAAGRMVSVMAGLGTMLGVGVLSFLFFKKKEIGFLASLLYLISPFTLFFDRMALADGLLAMLVVWCLVMGVGLVKYKRLDLAMITGIFLGLGLLTKSPALFIAILLPTTIIMIDDRVNFSKLFKIVFLWSVVYVFGLAIYNILRLGPEFHMIAIRNKDYIFSFPEVLSHPLNPFIGNFKNALSWVWIWLTPGSFVLGIVGIFLSLRKQPRVALVLFTWVFLPLLAQSAVAKVFTARYILFIVPFFLIFAAYSLEQFFRNTKSKVVVVSGLVIVFLLPIYQSLLLLTSPAKAWMPENERQGYLEMWTAGQGILESADYLKEVSRQQKVLVGTEGYFGTLPDGLQIYLEKVPNITIIGVGYPIKEIPTKLLDGLKDNRVFLLVNDTRMEVKDDKRLKLIAKYPKAQNPQTGSQENLLLFEVLK